jgi:hypothetical protein
MFKKLSFILLALFVLGGTAVAYAYWDNLQQTQNETITIGNGVTLQKEAVAVAPAGKVLVPTGVVLKANDVTSIVLTYNVKLDEAALTALNLSVSASNIQINGSSDYENLVNIAISPATTTVNATNVLITVTVTLTAPATVEIYNLIKNQPITFTLTFTATQA